MKISENKKNHEYNQIYSINIYMKTDKQKEKDGVTKYYTEYFCHKKYIYQELITFIKKSLVTQAIS